MPQVKSQCQTYMNAKMKRKFVREGKKYQLKDCKLLRSLEVCSDTFSILSSFGMKIENSCNLGAYSATSLRVTAETKLRPVLPQLY